MKILIAICDDEVAVTGELETKLEEMLNNMNIEYDIEVFYSGAKLIKAIESSQHYDLIFLDIEFAEHEINGVQVGSLIREKYGYNEVSIVFISREKRYHEDLLELQTLGFLHKPISYAKVDKILRLYLDIAGIRSSTITYRIGSDIFKIKVRDVVYVEILGRRLTIHRKDGEEIEFNGSMKKFYEDQLSKHDFILISSSYAVNYDFITHYKRDKIKLDGIEAYFTISQGRMSAVRAKCFAIENRREAK